ncbi:sodium- and chloride-dependent betaine transporter-like [Gigantopelta aegis]|uniref:sodium- and chloride-dependent betaine transporter-like n=1 Tax=Gigantopelta aegis TaxID=1735272 RepID=UPI001B88D278|nr:sodium- and chloride-dependent betaine transporter-like [Gigantopelta aegis]
MATERSVSHQGDAGTTETVLLRNLEGQEEWEEQGQIGKREKQGKETSERGQWTRQLDFLLSLVGYCVGPGNIWRFPYLCNRNGGGAFLIPYFIFLVLIAIPIFFLEVAVGQFSGQGVLQAWGICPLFKGIGLTMMIVSAINVTYFNLITGWVLYYLVSSFASALPWTTCGNAWNTPTCFVPDYSGLANNTKSSSSSESLASNTSFVNYTVFDDVTPPSGPYIPGNVSANTSLENGSGNRTMSAVEEFWQFNTLNISDGMENLGSIQLHMALCMLVAWFLIFLCLIKGVKSVGKVVYVTALLPYVLLVIFVIRTLMLPGARQGVILYVYPDFNRLFDFQVWAEALMQIFYTVGMCWGGLITMSSYNRFHNNCLRDAVFICLLGEGTSFFAGFAVFSVLGFMAAQMQVPVSEVVKAGPGLAFIAYPEALAQLPVPQMWAILFFLMMLTIGLDSVFAAVETVITAIVDSFPHVLLQKRILMTAVICIVCFLIGLPLSFQGGVYIFQLIDWYVAVFNLMFVGFIEVVIIGWIYGADRFGDDIELMLGRRPPLIIKLLWRFVSPLMLVMGMIITVTNYKPPSYGDYIYPGYAEIIGWSLALLPLLPIPICMALELRKAKGPIWQRLRQTTLPNNTWCPKSMDARQKYVTQRQTLEVY